jgi:hypothetical protein
MSRLCMRCQHAAETRRPATTHRAVQGGGNNASPARHPQPQLRRRERGVDPANRRATTKHMAESDAARRGPATRPTRHPERKGSRDERAPRRPARTQSTGRNCPSSANLG